MTYKASITDTAKDTPSHQNIVSKEEEQQKQQSYWAILYDEMSISSEVVVDLAEVRVDFTELPPQRLCCTVCNAVYRNPHSTSCCKTPFCCKCIEKIKKGGEACPNCEETEFEIAFDESTQRSINELYVRCLHVSEGCLWFGKLEHLHRHMDYTGGERTGGCMFVHINCPNNCGGKYTRKSLRDHLLGRCIKRSYDCEFCGSYHGKYDEVELEHFPLCPQYPVRCPNNCPARMVARSKLQFHLKNECDYQDNVPCVMQFAGCTEKLFRKNMSTHLQKSLAEHLAMIGKIFQDHKKEIEEKIDSLPTRVVENGHVKKEHEPKEENDADLEELVKSNDMEIHKVRAEVLKVKREKETQYNAMQVIIDGLRQSLQLQDQRLVQVEEQNQTLIRETSRLRMFTPNPLPITFTINKFDQLRQSGKWWYSRPFYTHYCGYKLGMFVFCNGVLDGKGTHLSVFLYLVRGEYDDELEWPFRANVTVQLLNQRCDRAHHQKVIRFTDDTPSTVSSRVLDAEMAKEGNGPTQFIAHSDLSYDPENDTEYVKDDCIKIKVTSVSIKGQHSAPRTPGVGTLPRNYSKVDVPRNPMYKFRSVESSTTDEPMSPKSITTTPSPTDKIPEESGSNPPTIVNGETKDNPETIVIDL